jgi:hypothetical protein
MYDCDSKWALNSFLLIYFRALLPHECVHNTGEYPRLCQRRQLLKLFNQLFLMISMNGEAGQETRVDWLPAVERGKRRLRTYPLIHHGGPVPARARTKRERERDGRGTIPHATTARSAITYLPPPNSLDRISVLLPPTVLLSAQGHTGTQHQRCLPHARTHARTLAAGTREDDEHQNTRKFP